MKKYDFSKIEKHWQKEWEENDVYVAENTSKKEKKYVLIEFPYPSGEGLHMGHLRPYVAGDVYSRFLRMKGHEVMYPIGWDAFGLPAENYAIKKGIHPSITTVENIKNAKRQIKSWGLGFDWSREVNTTNPEYYKWTQWIFLQLYKAGLAYEAKGFINWCPKDKTGLANEEVVGGCCERCGATIEEKELRQWYLKITAYAEKLLDGLKNLDWPERIKIQQENWIGKSEGAEIDFEVKGIEEKIKVFTTRPDTLFGVTYMVLAPEYELVLKLKNKISNWKEVEAYIGKARAKSEEERAIVKTGVKLEGVFAVNPANKKEIPVFVADYVLSGYGTGAIMAVPAHDERDFEFARKFNLPISIVISDGKIKEPLDEAYTSEGTLVNSEIFNGADVGKAKIEITKFVKGKMKVQYHLRDWVFSRQRYWGEPIPLVHCEKCKIVPVPEDELPVTLPEVEKYEPTGNGESPLAAIDSWVNIKCPKCGGLAKRETNTMPQWAGSSWYYLRYADPNNKKEFANKKALIYWLPVDVYFGGMEHTTLHLLYSRFWHQFLYDQKLVSTPEPYLRRIPHGIILGADGEKMSKSRGNIVSPDEMVKLFGADCLRMYELFLGPHEAMVSWNEKGILGVSRFLERIWKKLQENIKGDENIKTKRWIHKTVKKVEEDILTFKFNTAISALMIFLNETEADVWSKETKEMVLKVLAPFAPHLTEELWHEIGNKNFIHKELWPKYEALLLHEETFELVVQINGKHRGTITVPVGITEKEAKDIIEKNEKLSLYFSGEAPRKIIFIPKRLINFVI